MKKTVGVYGGKFNVLHTGHVQSIMRAYSQCDELFVFVMWDEEFEQERYERYILEKIEPFKRVRWITEITKDMENLHVTFIEHPNTYEQKDWLEGGRKMISYISEHSKYCSDGKFHKMFSSVPEYSEMFDVLYPFAKHIVLPQTVDCSATKILETGIMNNLHYLPNVVKRDFIKKIVLLGGESSGKSTMTKKLALYFNTEYVSEQGRTLWSKYNGGLGKVFEEKDYLHLTYAQKLIEQEKLDYCNKYLFVDTETIVTETWLSMYENLQNPILTEISRQEDYALYVLLEPIEFVQDGTRNFGEDSERLEVFEKMKQLLETYNKNYIIVGGNQIERFNKIIQEVEKL